MPHFRHGLAFLFILVLTSPPFICPALAQQAAGKPGQTAPETAKPVAQGETQEEDAAAPVCNANLGLMQARRVVDITSYIKREPDSILLLGQVADLLWPWAESEARDLFKHALERADKAFREPASEPGKWKETWTELENPHYVLLEMIARRDPAWAAKLAEKVVRDDQMFSLPSTSDFDPAGRRLGAALAIVKTDRNTAITLARTTLRYPASRALIEFLFRLAETDTELADGFYREAFRAYRWGPLEGFLTLGPYAFGRARVIYRDGFRGVGMPAKFAPQPQFQKDFMGTLVYRADGQIFNRLTPGRPLPAGLITLQDLEQIYLVLDDLDPLITRNTPEYSGASKRIREAALALLPDDKRHKLETRSLLSRPGAYREMLDKIERFPGWQDHYVAAAIQSAGPQIPPDRLDNLLMKLNNAAWKQPLRDYIWFQAMRAQIQGRPGQNAFVSASRVEQPELKAILYLEAALATALGPKENADAYEANRQQRRNALDMAETWASRAADSDEKALLTLNIASLYMPFDKMRAVDLATMAFRTLNHVNDSRLGAATYAFALEKPLRSGNINTTLRYEFRGLGLEECLRTLARADFNQMIDAAERLDNELSRARAMLAILPYCLHKPEKPKPLAEKQDAPKPAEKPSAPEKPAPKEKPKAAAPVAGIKA
ncbi:MAG: hypothetical protein ACKV2V_28285 [Blastocatellia bacterium]